MTISTSNGSLQLEVALFAPRPSASTGKSMLVATDRAKAFVTLPDGTRREVTVQVNAYFKA